MVSNQQGGCIRSRDPSLFMGITTRIEKALMVDDNPSACFGRMEQCLRRGIYSPVKQTKGNINITQDRLCALSWYRLRV